MLAVGYVRVSDNKQAVEGDSLTSQTKAIKKYAAQHGYTLVETIPEVFSGYYLRERKELAKVREMVRSKQIQVVLVNSFDRLSRETIHQAVLLNEMFEHDVQIESVTEKLDQTPMGMMMRQMLGLVASIEREKIIERNIRGVNNKVEKGVLLGTGRPKYGYSWGERHETYVVNPAQAIIVQRVFDMYASGSSARGIVKFLNDSEVPTYTNTGRWTASTIGRMLADEFYKGEAYNRRLKWLFVDGKRKGIPHPDPSPLPEGVVPAIISKELWAAVAAKRETAKQDSPRANPVPEETLVRSGFAFCGYCGRSMVVVRYSQKIKGRHYPGVHYRCGANGKFHNCKAPVMTAHLLDTAVWDFVKDVLADIDSLATKLLERPTEENSSSTVSSLDALIQATKEEIDRLFSDLEGTVGYVRELANKRINELNAKVETMKKQRAEAVPDAKREEQGKLEVTNFLVNCHRMNGNFDTMTYLEKRDALRILGVKVKVYTQSDADYPRYDITIDPKLNYIPTCSQIGTQFLVARTNLEAWIFPIAV